MTDASAHLVAYVAVALSVSGSRSAGWSDERPWVAVSAVSRPQRRQRDDLRAVRARDPGDVG